MLLKLKIFNRQSDPHAFRTVIGDPVSIFEVYFLLMTSLRADGIAVQKLEVTNLEGVVIDPCKGVAELHANATALSYGDPL